jgi:multidrug transporter EmrE-like cation transporter
MHKFHDIALLAIYVITSVGGLTLIKLGAQPNNLTFFIGVALYGAGFLLWFAVLARFPLSEVFPIAAGSLMIGTQLAGWGVLGETLGTRHLLGVATIIAGTLLLMSKQTP